MIRIKGIGAIAASGGLAGALAFSGLATARADELSDLQANVQLLQKEVAQLQQGRADPVVQAGSFHPLYHGGSFLMPGTNTSIAVSGYIMFQANYFLNGGSPNGNPTVSDAVDNGQLVSAPLDLHAQKLNGVTFSAPTFNPHSRTNGIVQFTARQSRLRIATETPTAYGPVTTGFEFDFFGCGTFSCNALDSLTNPNLARVRHAYATFGPFLAGQTWDPTFDLEAAPEQIDFGGPIGGFGKDRVPQVRYTWKGPYGISAAGAAQVSQVGAFTPNGGLANDTSPPFQSPVFAVNPFKATYPTLDGYLQWNQPWGHFRVQGVVIPMDIEDGRFISKEVVGFAGGFAGNVRPRWFGWTKDNILFQFGAGEGGGIFTPSDVDSASLATNFGAPGLYGSVGGPTTAAAAQQIRFTTITEWAGFGGYEHWWLPNLRSTIWYGIEHRDVPIDLVGPVQAMLAINREVWAAGANLIWSPVAFINTGFEYNVGERQTVGRAFGNMNVIEYEFQVLF